MAWGIAMVGFNGLARSKARTVVIITCGRKGCQAAGSSKTTSRLLLAMAKADGGILEDGRGQTGTGIVGGGDPVDGSHDG